jgi:hypothetical protein
MMLRAHSEADGKSIRGRKVWIEDKWRGTCLLLGLGHSHILPSNPYILVMILDSCKDDIKSSCALPEWVLDSFARRLE